MTGEPTWQRLLAERQHRAQLVTTRAQVIMGALGLKK